MQVAAIAAKALRAEIIGHTFAGDDMQPCIQLGVIGLQIGQPNKETVRAVCTALQLALVAGLFQAAQLITPQRTEIRVGTARQLQTEPLTGDRLTILQPGVADVTQRNTGRTSQLPGDLFRIQAALFQQQPEMLS